MGGGLGFGAPLPPVVPAGAGGVSINPGGRGGMGQPSAGAHGGSMESLNSTNSSTLSQLSYGSTISTGEGDRCSGPDLIGVRPNGFPEGCSIK